MVAFNESVVEEAALLWLRGIGYEVQRGPAIAPGEQAAEREAYTETILLGRLRAALQRLNPTLDADALCEAERRLLHSDRPTLLATNRHLHRFLVEGVPVETMRADGTLGGDLARVLSPDPDENDLLAVSQFTVVENGIERRPDIVLFVNGLPIVVIELKNAADENAGIAEAWSQLQTYKAQIPSLFAFNAALVVSDGVTARIGTLTADRERFMPWRTIEGDELATGMTELQVLIEGALDPRRLLKLATAFTTFEDDGSGEPLKKMAGYHQFHAVEVAVAETLRASVGMGVREPVRTGYRSGPFEGSGSGDRRIGVVWHTQGSGKSLTMAFYAGRLVRESGLENPTIVVLTDRNDLDDQLFGTFARCRDLLRQAPEQARDRANLRELLSVAGGGIVFTTVQKFFPESGTREHPILSDRRNIVVIADEAHRSQYDFIDGYARHLRDALPKASFIGFTGTPIEAADANTRAVFGDYISTYDITRAVADGATVPIYYEGRLAKLQLKDDERPRLDDDFEEATEGEEQVGKERLKTKWAALEALAGAERRVDLVARDLVQHFERRLEAMDGKAMVVCMSRRICVDLYNAIVRLRPDWHHEGDGDEAGTVKIVMTGSATDPVAWQSHIRSKSRREELANRFKDPADPFRIVIVRDMWLTGFDAPSLHTMYVDKPMKGHGLMQAIARVNRVFRDKPGGLVVDYLGLADQLRQALADYTAGGGTGNATVDQAEAVALLKERYEVLLGLFHGFDRSAWTSDDPAARLSLLPKAQEHILAQEDGKERLVKTTDELSKAFALAVPHEDAIAIRDDVGFFQAVRAVLGKGEVRPGKSADEMEHAIRQIVSRAVASDEVVDIFAAAGLKRPDIGILSDEFLAEVRGLPHRNLAVETLRKLLMGEIKSRTRRNVVQARSFAEMLDGAVRRYQNRAIETAQVIEELIALAKEMREADERGERLGLSSDEVAFYDALEIRDDPETVMEDEQLKIIARELVVAIRRNVTIDWAERDSIRAAMRVLVKRILRKHGYPPNQQERAVETVLEQAELLCAA